MSGQIVSLALAQASRGIPVYIAEEDQEHPVRKAVCAAALGVHTRTVDRYIERGMPQDKGNVRGCWIQAGAHRRFYISRVRQWLASPEAVRPG